MPLAVDSEMPSNAGDGSGGGPSSPRTFSFTNTAGDLMIAVIALGVAGPAGGAAFGAVSFDGVALTKLLDVQTGAGVGGRLGLFYLTSPATGAKTFSYAFTLAGGGNDSAMCGVTTFSGANLSTPFPQQPTGSGSDATPTITLTAVASGNLSLAGAGGGTSMSGQTQTLSWAKNVNDNTSLGNSRCSRSASTGSVTHSFTMGGSDTWLTVAVEIASAAVPVINTQPVGQACYVGQTAVFTIAATTSGGTLHYQWKKNGSNVGSDQNSYTTPTAVLADNGSTIQCVVTDDNGSTTSDTVLWNVMNSTPVAWLRA